ncbi:MAG: hypothetical protein ACK4YP_02045, partial [Myxococcota bacterium]
MQSLFELLAALRNPAGVIEGKAEGFFGAQALQALLFDGEPSFEGADVATQSLGRLREVVELWYGRIVAEQEGELLQPLKIAFLIGTLDDRPVPAERFRFCSDGVGMETLDKLAVELEELICLGCVWGCMVVRLPAVGL